MSSSSSSIVQQIEAATDLYLFTCSILNLIIGVISTLSIILIFTSLRAFRGNQCAFYLTIESITDLGLILFFFPPHIAYHFQGQNFARQSLVWCKLTLMCSYGFGLCSLYIICSMALDQYLSTNHRYSWRQMSTLKLAHRLTLAIISFAWLHSTLFPIFADIRALGCSIYHPIVKFYFAFFYYPIMSGVLPLILSTTFSLLAYRNVRRLVRRQTAAVRRRLDHQMTAIALSRVLCIVTLGVPFLGTSLYELNVNSSEQNDIQLAITRLIAHIAQTLLHTNYSVSHFSRTYGKTPFTSTDLFFLAFCRSISMYFCSYHPDIVTR
jgi:hypothetical protein